MSSITVLMPIYNAELFLKEAIDSVLNQSFKEFNLLLINDGSTDNSEDIIMSYSDSRIIYVKNEKNLGIVKTLNKGLDMIQTKYIVRMDSDDIMETNKLEIQYKFMEEHDDIAVVGTNITKFYSNGKRKKIRLPLNHNRIKSYLLFDSALMHPTVMIRNSIIKENDYKYQEAFKGNEDYQLWLKISKKYKLANLPQSLLKYRVNENSITQKLNNRLEKYDESFYLLFNELFLSLGLIVKNDEVKIWRNFTSNRCSLDELYLIIKFIQKLKNALPKNEYDLLEFNNKVSQHFRMNCINQNLEYKDLMFFNSTNVKIRMIDQLLFFIRKGKNGK